MDAGRPPEQELTDGLEVGGAALELLMLCALERGRHAMIFASGMAAATSVFLSLSHGDHVVQCDAADLGHSPNEYQ